ncbi:MAG: iron-sulfur cluster-binding protein [Chloroflexi bacterium]|nr:iron-sulfur cluster-binding protein [Chloroflexota bacterium]
MKLQANQFIDAARIALQDDTLYQSVKKATGKAYNGRISTMSETSPEHGQAMRQHAAYARRRGLMGLPDLLELAEQRLTENGVTVLWAVDAAEACAHVQQLANEHGVQKVVKSKSMLSEEIGLNHALEEAGITVVETDLGEYILQLSEEAPSHIVTPVIHKSKESIRDLFVEKINMPLTDEAAEMARFARQVLREDFLTADMGISGGNFVIAETGTLCLATNEGNARMVTTMPHVHVAVVGIEKVIESLEVYAMLAQVLSRSATGQKMTVYNHMINGPRRPDDPDGPEHVVVVFVDNGRSRIYGSTYAEALACIRCGACLNACPIYQQMGGHAYGWVYPGPIGSVVTPLLNGPENASPLPHASSLCGACKEACPVDIDIPRMLLELRHDLVEMGVSDIRFDVGMQAWMRGMTSQMAFMLGSKAASITLRALPIEKMLPRPLSGWTDHREFPTFAPKTFHQLWKERNNEQS